MGRTRGKPYEVVRWMQVIDGQKLQRHRKRNGLTQRELAFLVKTSQTTIYLLETGGMKTLTEKLALAIAKRLDMPWEDLFVAREAPRMSGVTNDGQTVSRETTAPGQVAI